MRSVLVTSVRDHGPAALDAAVYGLPPISAIALRRALVALTAPTAPGHRRFVVTRVQTGARSRRVGLQDETGQQAAVCVDFGVDDFPSRVWRYGFGLGGRRPVDVEIDERLEAASVTHVLLHIEPGSANHRGAVHQVEIATELGYALSTVTHRADGGYEIIARAGRDTPAVVAEEPPGVGAFIGAMFKAMHAVHRPFLRFVAVTTAGPDTDLVHDTPETS